MDILHHDLETVETACLGHLNFVRETLVEILVDNTVGGCEEHKDMGYKVTLVVVSFLEGLEGDLRVKAARAAAAWSGVIKFQTTRHEAKYITFLLGVGTGEAGRVAEMVAFRDDERSMDERTEPKSDKNGSDPAFNDSAGFSPYGKPSDARMAS